MHGVVRACQLWGRPSRPHCATHRTASRSTAASAALADVVACPWLSCCFTQVAGVLPNMHTNRSTAYSLALTVLHHQLCVKHRQAAPERLVLLRVKRLHGCMLPEEGQVVL